MYLFLVVIMTKYPRAGVGVMVVRNHKVLLGLRHSDAEKASSELHGEGTWTMPGGKVDWHQTIKESAIQGYYRSSKNRIIAKAEMKKVLNLICQIST